MGISVWMLMVASALSVLGVLWFVRARSIRWVSLRNGRHKIDAEYQNDHENALSWGNFFEMNNGKETVEDAVQEKTRQGFEGGSGSPEVWDQVDPVDLSGANNSDLSGDIHQVDETKCSKKYGPTLFQVITDGCGPGSWGGLGSIFVGLVLAGIALASVVESVDVERSASWYLPSAFLLAIFLLLSAALVYNLAISFRYLVRTKPFCAHCGNRPVRFLGRLQGEWFLSDKDKRSVFKGEVDTKPCKAGVETFWECPVCNAVTRCWHLPDVKPSEKKKILKINLVRDGVGKRVSSDWEKKDLDSTCGESRDSWRK